MKTCIKCKAQLEDNAKFCPSCGTKQEEKVFNIKGTKIVQSAGGDDDEFFAPHKKVDHSDIQKESTSTPENSLESPISTIETGKNISSEIASYEFIDESIVIDDPFASKIDVVQEEQSAMSEENVQKAKEILESFCISEEMLETLYPILSPHVRGYRCIITGNDGTNKESSIEKLGKILKTLDKIDSDEIIYLPFGDIPEKFDVRRLYVIGDLSSAIERLFNLEDVSDEANHLQQQYKVYMERLLKAPKSAYIILNGYITQIKGFMSLDPRVRYIFSQRVDFPDLTNEEIYKIFYDALPEFHKLQLPDSFEYEFNGYLERNKRFFPFNNQELALYLAQTSSKQAEFKLPKEKYNAASLEEAFSTIIGMQSVKDQVYELSQYLKARKDLEAAGAKLPSFHLHMMFLGNPGVGKTTIARIIAKVLFDLGYIREEKLVEVTSKDLVGNGNQTGIKTNKVILNALGGVLFVDEAYSLAKSCGTAGEEVISNLIKAMEDYKSDLVVMFAGYTLEMNDFVKINSGISSRIAYTFQFQDYTVDELYDIFKLKIGLANMNIAPDAETPIRKIIEWGANRKNFGNGRYIDKLIQRILTKHATLNLPKKEILTIRKESVCTIEEIMQSFGRFMG